MFLLLSHTVLDKEETSTALCLASSLLVYKVLGFEKIVPCASHLHSQPHGCGQRRELLDWDWGLPCTWGAKPGSWRIVGREMSNWLRGQRNLKTLNTSVINQSIKSLIVNHIITISLSLNTQKSSTSSHLSECLPSCVNPQKPTSQYRRLGAWVKERFVGSSCSISS